MSQISQFTTSMNRPRPLPRKCPQCGESVDALVVNQQGLLDPKPDWLVVYECLDPLCIGQF